MNGIKSENLNKLYQIGLNPKLCWTKTLLNSSRTFLTLLHLNECVLVVIVVLFLNVTEDKSEMNGAPALAAYSLKDHARVLKFSVIFEMKGT